MTFDIHQGVFTRDGESIDETVSSYREELLDLFWESPEGQALVEEGIDLGFWANSILDYGIGYLGVTPPQMSPAHLREILFDLIPRKVSAEADQAPVAIRELQAFWTFLQREFHLANAAACLTLLDDKAVQQLQRAMSNPANFGIAKSFVMMGSERGFDMSTDEGVHEWMTIYNAEVAAGKGKRIPSPFEKSVDAEPAAGSGPRFLSFDAAGQNRGAMKAQDKIKHKMARESRKKNRKKR
jgi:hypothetical protein